MINPLNRPPAGSAPRPGRHTQSRYAQQTRAHAPKTRLRGFDGIRAIAALFVLVYHLIPGKAPAGFAGVDIFFVLSGFLITSLLMDQWQVNGKLDVKEFWKRRVRRLLPAVVVTALGACAMALVAGGDALVGLPRQFVGAVTATYNWVQIASSSSYFEQSSPLLLTNMWSLAVEQQFYLVWPVLLVLMVPLAKKYKVWITLGLGALSVILHALLASGDLSRAYMGTDSHLWGLMIGAALAFAIPNAMRMGGTHSPNQRAWSIAGPIALVAAMLMMVLLPESFMYPWGMLIVSLTIALTLRSLLPDVSYAGPSKAMVSVLDSKLFVWLGERSYGIYLWHWPLWVLAFYIDPRMNVYVTALIVIVASLILAALSYRYIETPIRTQGFRSWLHSRIDYLRQLRPVAVVAYVTIPVLVVAMSGIALAVSPDRSSAQLAVEAGTTVPIAAPPQSDETAPASDAGGAQAKDDHHAQASDAGGAQDSPQASDGGGAEEQQAQMNPTFKTRVTPTVPGEKITVIGDSLTVASTNGLEGLYPGISIDAEVSRSIKVAPDMLKSRAASGKLREYVVVALATNSRITDKQIDELVEIVGSERKLILVTGFGPARASWIPEANEAIRNAPSRHTNVYVAEWHDAIEQQTKLLAGDSVHPRGLKGVGVYVDAISTALNKASQGN